MDVIQAIKGLFPGTRTALESILNREPAWTRTFRSLKSEHHGQSDINVSYFAIWRTMDVLLVKRTRCISKRTCCSAIQVTFEDALLHIKIVCFYPTLALITSDLRSSVTLQVSKLFYDHYEHV